MRTSGLLAFLTVWAATAPAGSGAVLGNIDVAGDANGNPSVQQSATLFVRGWAADQTAGAPVVRVLVFLDGNTFLGDATLGSVRTDVAQAYSRNDFLSSGWTFQISAASISVGTHSITAVANGPSTSATLTGIKTINITSSAGSGQTIGFVDTAGDANGLTNVTKGTTLFVQGWAVDSINGAPVLGVLVFVDGFNVGSATLGLPRSDVAQAYGSASFLNSGWTFQMPTSTLSIGSHIITATANGTSGAAPLTGSKNMNLTAQASGQEIGFVDFAGDLHGGLSVVQGGTLFAQGWAADTSTGAPVQTVTVFIDGVAAGTATLGSLRPDVVTSLGRNDYTTSGWTFQMSTSSLSVATHNVTASATGPSGTAALIGTKTFTVTAQPVGQVIGFVDYAAAQGTTVTIQGWAADLVSGAPVQSVTVVVDGTFTVFATLGLARPDVALALNRSDFANSGWTTQVTFGSPTGSHSFTAYATGLLNTAPLVGVRIVTFP